jgi:hypothetical protein
MKRRVFLCEVSVVAIGVAWRKRPLARALADGARRNTGVAVCDPTLAEGRALARRAASAGYVAWNVADGDIGGLWHAQIVRHIAPRAVLVGALRASDRFVLARLAAARGVTLHDFVQQAQNR